MQRTIRNALWIGPWLGGQVLIGMPARYGNGAKGLLSDWLDIAVVIIFALEIFYWAVSLSLTQEESAAAVMKARRSSAHSVTSHTFFRIR